MKSIIKFIKKVGVQSIGLFLAALLILAFTGNIRNPFIFMCLGAFVWENLRVIKKLVMGEYSEG